MRQILAALALLAPVAPAAQADLLYVLNSGEATISLIDATTREEIRRVPVLREPHHLVKTPDGSELVIADSGGNELIFVEPSTGEVKRRERISNPYHLDYSPDGKYLVIASLRRDQVDVYDAASLTLLQRFRPGDMPSHVAFSPDSKRAFVTLQGDRAVAAFDLDSRTQLWTVQVGPQPAGVLWHRGKLIVGIMGADHFVTLDPETRAVAPAFGLGRGAHTVFPSPDGRALYATSRVDSRVAEVDPDTLTVRRIWNIPGGPDCLTFDPEGRVWMTLRWVGRIAVLDPSKPDWELIRVGRSPHGIYFEPRRDGMGRVSGSVPASRPAHAEARPADLPTPAMPASMRR
jgi:YVTN family beta-propeller protein